MTTTDPYRLDGFPGSPDPARQNAPREAQEALSWDRFVRTVLWLVLVISTVGNMVASYSAASTGVHLVCGGVTALCVTALVVRHLRGRR
ncbi:hypothetical protein C6Y14_06080 [Streptomyces dioscori]|uniref:DUF202 domain-containing protein n=1 Tax=Streptomyces dioscori TaxID=2109333 RepID=A0A2P8QCE8_9ACTN|nr:hypothetical protein [Streptomyces dioscori]PSM43945.1 hypothetical protein C6Y14_06080 [Streptomyces dioscori]